MPANIDRIAGLIAEWDIKRYTEIRSIPLKYANIDKVAAILKNELTDGIGALYVDEDNNKIIIEELPEKLGRFQEIVQEVDERIPQVEIQAKILQVALNDEFKLGVNWEYITKKLNGLNATANFDILSDGESGLRVTSGNLEDDNYTGLLEALESVGKINVLSSPRITVLNNHEAKILVGSSVPYKSVDTIQDQGVINRFEKVVFIDVGIRLYVTPTINDDGYVRMYIKPEISSVVGFREGIPVVETAQSETTLMIKDSTTIVLGGLIKKEKLSEVRRVPILGRIPLLGRLFSSTKNTDNQTELIVFITPYIVAPDVSVESPELPIIKPNE